MPVDESSKEITAFTTRDGLFQFNRVPFGLKTAPAYFQRVMNRNFNDLLYNACLIYLDDIIVFGRTLEEVKGNLEKVLRRLTDLRLSLNREKCRIGCKEVEYLGFIVNAEGRKVSPERITMLREMGKPETKKDVRRMLGMATYLMAFIPNFSRMIEPISRLVKGDGNEVSWETEQAEAWRRVVECLEQKLMLFHPDPEATMVL
ncbi:uncharacterized protein LOC105663869, partial [Aduncisulcus paluster]